MADIAEIRMNIPILRQGQFLIHFGTDAFVKSDTKVLKNVTDKLHLSIRTRDISKYLVSAVLPHFAMPPTPNQGPLSVSHLLCILSSASVI